MSFETWISIGTLALMMLLLWFFVPVSRIREAIAAFLFMKLLTWSLGLVVVELGWIEYPLRFFSRAHRTSFIFEYFVFPAASSLFNVHYPEHKSVGRQSLHYLLFAAPLTIMELLLRQYTKLIVYLHWTWYATFLSLIGTLFITRVYMVWFKKGLQGAKCSNVH